MALRYLMDHNVDAAISRGLRDRGVDVLMAFEDGSHRLRDEPLLLRALELGRILVTQDDDFLEIAARFQREGREFLGVLYSHQANTPVGLASICWS